MKILLLNPYRDKERYVPVEVRPYVKYTPTDLSACSVPPLDLAYLAGVLKDKAVVSILDAHMLRLHPERIDFSPYDVVVMNTAPFINWRCAQTFIGHTLESLRAAKKAGARTVVYGPHVTTAPDAFDEADCVVLGEPEEAIERAVFGKERRLGPEPAQELPQPDYGAFDFSLYESRACDAVFERNPFGRVGVLAHSRGCPFHCTFCFRALAPRRVRFHSLASVAETLKDLIEVYQCRCLFFEDLTFTLDKERTLEICGLLARYRVPYVIQTRTDRVDEDIARALADSGCYKIEFGLESGAQSILESLNKGNSWDDVVRAIQLCRRAGIPRVVGFAGLFAPGETLETIRETRRRFRELDLRFYVNIWFPYPGTGLHEHGMLTGADADIGGDWTPLLAKAGTIGTAFTTEQVRAICDRIERQERRRELLAKAPRFLTRLRGRISRGQHQGGSGSCGL